jgi:MFS family permease
VAAGLRAYGAVLADPGARSFSAAGFFARLPVSMTGISIVLFVSLSTGSFGRAGLVAAAMTVTSAACAPLWGRLIDRAGQARVLVLAALLNSVSISVLVTAVLLGWPFGASLVAAAGVGAGFSSAGAAVRARWSYHLGDRPLLNTAFAFEAVVDEAIFIVGPVLATFLCTSLHPALGIIVGGLVGLGGALALAAQRRTQPPVHARHATDRPAVRLPVRVLITVAAASLALGMVFGGMEVVVVGYAKAAGILPYSGVILMVWAFGSLLAGVATGSIAWKASPARRFRLGALALGLSLLPLPFVVAHPMVVAAVLVVSGFAIAPTLIASVAVVQGSVPASRLTEALAWTSTGLAGGVAAGAAVLGQLIDHFGADDAFWGVVGAGGLLVVLALLVRTPPSTGTDEPEPAEPEPGRLQTDEREINPAPTGTPADPLVQQPAETPWR